MGEKNRGELRQDTYLLYLNILSFVKKWVIMEVMYLIKTTVKLNLEKNQV